MQLRLRLIQWVQYGKFIKKNVPWPQVSSPPPILEDKENTHVYTVLGTFTLSPIPEPAADL